MAIGDKYEVTVNVTHAMTVNAVDETKMVDDGLDPTDVNDVMLYFRRWHLDRAENTIFHTFKMRGNDLTTWPQAELLVGNEVAVWGPV